MNELLADQPRTLVHVLRSVQNTGTTIQVTVHHALNQEEESRIVRERNYGWENLTRVYNETEVRMQFEIPRKI